MASNPMIAKAEQGIKNQMKPELQGKLTEVVSAGLKMINDAIALQAKHFEETKDFVKEAGSGAARMITRLYAKGSPYSKDVIIPAAMVFGMEYIDSVEKAGKIKVTPDVLAAVTKAVSDAVFPMIGITGEKMQQMIKERHDKDAKPQGIINQAVQA